MPARPIAASLLLVSFAAYGQTLLDDATIGKLVKSGISDQIQTALIARAETPPADADPTNDPAALTLHDAAPIRLRLTRDLTFTNIRPGEMVDFEILDDLRIDGLLVMARGWRATATITEAEPKTRLGRGGKLGVDLGFLPLLNGDQVAIRPAREDLGGGRAAGAAVPAAAIVRPAAPSLLFKFGKFESFPEGTRITVYIDGDLKLDPRRFLFDIAFTSSPSGAMVSMYGAHVGRTPFNTRLAPGTYTAIFSVAGYYDLTQSISVGPGRPNTVHAAFELK